MYTQKSQLYYPPLEHVAGHFSWIQERPDDYMPRRTEDTTKRFAATTAVMAMASTLVTAAACLIPWIALSVGIGGLGFLTRYTYLQVPATIVTVALLSISYRALRRSPCQGTTSRLTRGLFWFAVALAVAINLIEYVVLPALA
ncbi:hypothetical protein QVZ43_09230 [Marinobacter sp. chi1]|uniref:Mercuric transport protein MerT n=1 Tax=Marinobacter suaedae TaxID=3057675 RepID=A0ABT8W0X4_9GAMM|nr:hypothetical protein [Marinobacter sp. chi1]MDO3721906.1 hypothetical protein [Marinobacter sp. chi1]